MDKIEKQKRTEISYVCVVIDRGTAGIDSDLLALQGHKGTDCTRLRIVDFERHRFRP